MPRAPLLRPEGICQIMSSNAAGKATMPPKINAIASPSPLNIVVLQFQLHAAPRVLSVRAIKEIWDLGLD